VRNYLILGASLSLLAGCAPFQHTEAPLASNFYTTNQMKLQAGHHWQVIADDMADSIAAALVKGGVCIAPAGSCPAVFVAPATPASQFAKAFQTSFVTRLVGKDLKIATAGPSDINVAIDIQAVRFSPGRSQYLGVGKFTMLSTGLWGLHEIHLHRSAGAAVVAATIAADVYEWNMSEFAKGPTPQMEVIVTASATKGKQFIARTTNVYYIADTDAELYAPPSKGPVAIRVIGDGGAAK